MICVGLAPSVQVAKIPKARTMIQKTLNLVCFMSSPQPRIPELANAAARGAVRVLVIPAAKRPIPKITVAQLLYFFTQSFKAGIDVFFTAEVFYKICNAEYRKYCNAVNLEITGV